MPALGEFWKQEHGLAAQQRRQHLALAHLLDRGEDARHWLGRVEVPVVEMPRRGWPLRGAIGGGSRRRKSAVRTGFARTEDNFPVAAVDLPLLMIEASRAEHAEERHRLEGRQQPQALAWRERAHGFHDLLERLAAVAQRRADIEINQFSRHRHSPVL
ncbi:MAG TPA: hypothetical protein VJP82_07915 [Sphingomicrobium sp.]|nr:hypothetical protein [Sphingomicrobium sp.]